MSKTYYTVAGVSTKDGVQSVRYANTLKRKTVLEKCGHTDVKLIAMPYEGRVEDCVNTLLSHPEFANIPCVREEALKLGFIV